MTRSVLLLSQRDDALCFAVRVSPRAARDAIAGVHDGALKVSLTAPPVDGAANSALIALLARRLRVAKRAVEIVGGQQSKQKRVCIRGVDADALHGLYESK